MVATSAETGLAVTSATSIITTGATIAAGSTAITTTVGAATVAGSAVGISVASGVVTGAAGAVATGTCITTGAIAGGVSGVVTAGMAGSTTAAVTTAVASGTAASSGAATLGAIACGPVGWCILGADNHTWDCWKPILHVNDNNQSSGILFNKLLSHPDVISFNDARMIVTNKWNECFHIKYVLLPDMIALHADRV
jgi:hypothetical protein